MFCAGPEHTKKAWGWMYSRVLSWDAESFQLIFILLIWFFVVIALFAVFYVSQGCGCSMGSYKSLLQ